MEFSRRQYEEDRSFVSNLEHIICGSCRIPASSSTVNPVVDLSIAPHSLGAVLQEVAAPIPGAESKDTV